MSVDFKNKDWHYASWLHICQSKKLGKMQFFNPHENCSCSHRFEKFQSTYVLNQDFEVYPKKAAIFTSGMYLYLLKAKALKTTKKAKKCGLNMVKRYLNRAVYQQFQLHCAYLSKCSFWLLEGFQYQNVKGKSAQRFLISLSLPFVVSAF